MRPTIDPIKRNCGTRGFDIEAVPLEDETRSPANPPGSTLIAAIPIHGRYDGAASRPIEKVFETRNRPLIEVIGRTLKGPTERQRKPISSKLGCPRSLDLRPARRLDRMLWQSWADYPITGYAHMMVMLDGIKCSGLARVIGMDNEIIAHAMRGCGYQ